MNFNKDIVLKPIGLVKLIDNGDEGSLSKVIVDKKFIEALEGVEDFSHLFILYWLNQISDEQKAIRKVHPRGKKDLPLVGVFATRSMIRPNSIALTLVELVNVEQNVLTVKGLDAFDGTPVLDIKPYDPWDNVKKIKVPEWWLKLEKERNRKRV